MLLHFWCPKKDYSFGRLSSVVDAEKHPCMAEGVEVHYFGWRDAENSSPSKKHSDLFLEHSDIKPDWLRRTNSSDLMNDREDLAFIGGCDICGLKFTSLASQEDHRTAFVPSDVGSNVNRTDHRPFECTYCKKVFRENQTKQANRDVKLFDLHPRCYFEIESLQYSPPCS